MGPIELEAQRSPQTHDKKLTDPQSLKSQSLKMLVQSHARLVHHRRLSCRGLND